MLRKAVGLSVVGGIVALAIASLAVGQPQGMGGGPGRGNFDPERMQQMMEERLQEQLGATDEEWKVLGPRVMKVMTLSRQSRGMGGMGRMFMGRRRGQDDRPDAQNGRGGGQGGRAGRQGAPDNADRGGPRRGMFGEPTPVDLAAEQLQTTLENPSASPEDIKSKLTALRTAREKAKQELAKAQKDLREVLTLRQEAELVVMGMLD